MKVLYQVPANLCRKALKLGKFLADVDKLRKLSTHSHMWVAQLVAASGEVVYLFMEQVTWWAYLHPCLVASDAFTTDFHNCQI